MRGESFSCSVRHSWRRTRLLQAGDYLVVAAWINIYDTLYQCCLELFAAFVCADVEAGADYSYLIHLRMYVEW